MRGTGSTRRALATLGGAAVVACASSGLLGPPLAEAKPPFSSVHGIKTRAGAGARTTSGATPRKMAKHAPAPAPAPVVAGTLSALTVRGNEILRNGAPFHFYGVNRDTLEWGHANYGGCGGDGHFADHDFEVMRTWGITAVRLPLSQAGWLGRSCPGVDYAALVDAAIAKINAHGMYAIVDLHWSDAGGRNPCPEVCVSGQQPMPDGDSLVFWRSVAQRYANDAGVIFGLYNEPHDVSWGCWRNGGCDVWPAALTGGLLPFKAVGMQQLYDAVRSQGAHNLTLVAGLQYAYDLSGVGSGYALSGTNIAYDTHVYTAFHSTAADWDRSFGFLTDGHPVVATEFGSNDCSAKDSSRLVKYFEAPMGKAANRMSWTVWSWGNPGNCLQPSVIADWEGTPLGDQGAMIKQAILAARP